MKRLLTVIFLAALLCSCSGTWLMYDITQKDRLYFTVEGASNVASFALLASDEMHYPVPVSIVGTPKEQDRIFRIELIDAVPGEKAAMGSDSITVQTAKEGRDFEIGELVIPAGQVKGSIDITLKRTPEMNGTFLKLHMRIVETDDFLPMDADSSVMKSIITPEFVLLMTDGEPACPEWWKTESKGVDYEWGAYYGKYKPAKFRLMLDYYHAIEGKNPGLWEDLLAKYGYNIDKEGLPRNFMSTNDQSVWASYVLIPLHDYYVEYYAEHPDEAENFGNTGDLTTFTWGDPLRLLR